MNIGIVTTWFERGAAYVSKNYMELLEKGGNCVYIFARGGENIPTTLTNKWMGNNVTRSTRYTDSQIEKVKFKKWIRKNKIEAILFNEQQDFRVLLWLKKDFPSIKTAAYVDYYTERTIHWFELYDFLICNTNRHMQAMASHPQKFYIKWGTNIDLYKPQNLKHKELTFFHSVGMSLRKGTDILIDAFIDGEVYKHAKLIIHTQIPIEKNCCYTKHELKKYNVKIIEKTVSAPGLYYMGDIYVYPTRLDGLGLTMYEALASGLPLITSDFPPMNEVGTLDFVKRVKIDTYYCRKDAYYFPMVICEKNSLIEAMMWYVNHPEELEMQKRLAREYAEKNYNIENQYKVVCEAFEQAQIRFPDKKILIDIKTNYFKNFALIDWILRIRIINNLKNIIAFYKNKLKKS